ncbi:2-dehydropantoate 2-reductase [Pseudooceanicola sp. CBS1P-1]|uniref:2-dehydropantoate 2-reductase n=1 Tax=Pseudooceanicola albus TaxID=2692189 RepID=A0A6L7G4K2_9RHOB|nr:MULTISPECIES: 2-dehydropantoate 2-reductase [Pseudooceanicola]MBT9383106.1 2-dehydropantoate 2-reductase [Pseudooceanicola endophyticus]MXN19294.1 2-dehydropantoate 2-reductase [Pseudooceanicola albus]
MTQLPPLPDRPLSVCIVGTGAIGGSMAARIAGIAGGDQVASVSVVARGATLEAIRRDGLRLRCAGQPEQAIPVTATDDPDTLPPQDLVITALKGHQIPPMADKLARLLAPAGRILPVVNGLPWWYPVRDGKGGHRGAEEVDPGGRLWARIGPGRAIGAIAYLGVSQPEPGCVSIDIEGYFDIGRMEDGPQPDVDRVQALLEAAGLTIARSRPFGQALWHKILTNASTNSVCAIARQPMNVTLADPQVADLSVAIMREVLAIAAAEGLPFDYDIAARLEKVRGGAPFKPSTLQDVEAGRPLEIEPIFAAPLSVARSHGIDCPNLALVTGLLRLIDQSRPAG